MMIKKIYLPVLLALAIIVTLPFLNSSPSYAVTKCYLTKIGPNAPKEVVYPAGCQTSGGAGPAGSCGAVVDFSQKIIDNLNPSDNLVTPVTSPCGQTLAREQWTAGTYWCATSVVDAYNLAGIPGLSGESVVGIHTVMDSNPAFIFVDYRTNKEAGIKQVKPGWAFFIEGTFRTHIDGQQHTGVIKTITMDDRGNGELVTLESNGGRTSKTWPIANWEVQLNDTRPLVGFGGGK